MKDFVQCRASGESILKPSLIFIEKILEYSFESIIDFGCGFGHHVRAFSEAGREATGVDIRFDDEAKKDAKAFGYQLIEGSWEQIKTESYDVGFSHHCLEHSHDPISWLNEWARIIKPGGKFFVSVPSYRSDVLAGHIFNGWNCNQLAYILSISGFDCREGLFEEFEDNVWAFVDRPEDISIVNTHVFGFGQAAERMPKSMAICQRGVRFIGSPEKIFNH